MQFISLPYWNHVKTVILVIIIVVIGRINKVNSVQWRS